jgi:5-methylcytosine-specific restriction endonuclease McrA
MKKPHEKPETKRRRQREWIANRRKQWIDENGPCVICGSLVDLQVDHINPTEKVSHRVFSWSKERREVELAKCQVLCFRCHRNKTTSDCRTYFPRPVNHIHGTTTEYRRGCRCELCVASKKLAMIEYRALRVTHVNT